MKKDTATIKKTTKKKEDTKTPKVKKSDKEKKTTTKNQSKTKTVKKEAPKKITKTRTTKKKTTKKTPNKKVTTKKQVNKFDYKLLFNNILKYIQIGAKFLFKVICIILVNLWKYFLIFLKFTKNLIIKIYNLVKELINKKRKNKKKKKKTIKKTKKDKNDITREELVLLRYRDHKFYSFLKVFFVNRIRVMKFDMERFKKKFKYGTLKDKILIILMLVLIATFSLIIVFCGYIILTAPEVTEKKLYKNNSTVLYDINGNEFARLGTENREKVAYDELPEVLIDAIVATEDSRFFQHNGVDIARFFKASVGQVLGRSDAGGGSTLTMQVSKNSATSFNSHGIKGIIRKFTDIYISVFVLEKKYTKEQIMEFYVNIPNLGAGAYGVQQASQIYFGKDASELNLVEAATIAGLFQAPSSYNPYAHPKAAEARRNTVLNLMCRHGYITEEERDTAKQVPIESTLVGLTSQTNIYQDYIDTVILDVLEQTDPDGDGPKTGDDPTSVSMQIWTTMDPKKQDVVNGVINGDTYKWKNDKAQAGIAVVSVKDGSIRAVGASRDPNQRVTNFAWSIKRHPGSTAKPVIDYGPAIEYLNWSTGTTIVDDKLTYSSGGSIKNWDNGYKGVMTVKKALAQSRNIPALFTFQQTTNEQKAEFVKNMGWTPETNGNGVLLESCSIGGFDGVTPVESAAAFATFARGGTYIEPHTFTKIIYTDTGETIERKPNRVQAMSEETAYLINMILRFAVTSGQIGAGSVSGTEIAAKTGTSTVDSKAKRALGIKANVIGDSWEVAYSPDYAISTWYGYEPKLSKKYYLTGKEGGNARKVITKTLVKGIMEKNAKFKRPKGVTTATIELGTDPLELASEHTPKDLKSTEYFKKGTAPSNTSERFANLSNPSNLHYTSTSTSVSLSWSAAALPNQLDINYLNEYFSKSNAYKKWAEKYANQRLKENKDMFGEFGYRVYLQNANGTQELGFTKNTSFTTNVQFDSTTTFIVKSSYQKFTSNQSKGISVVVAPNSQSNIAPEVVNTTAPVKTENNMVIEYRGSRCSTVDEYNSLGSSPYDKVKVLVNNNDVTTSSNISIECCQDSDNCSSSLCNSLVSGQTYTVYISVKYGNLNRTKIVNLKNGTC